MSKIKSITTTTEYDEYGSVVATWESKEYHPEPREKANGGITPGTGGAATTFSIPATGCTITNCYSGSLRS